MPRVGGVKPKPIEHHRRVGATRVDFPDEAHTVKLPAPRGVPEPMRQLGTEGTAMWVRVWSSGAVWLADKIDAETILVLCEQVDERQMLRQAVMNSEDWRDRPHLRVLEKSIIDTLGFLGFNPSDRRRLAVAEVVASPLDDMMAARRAKSSGA